MNDIIEMALTAYVVIAALLLTVGVLEWRNDRDQTGARLILASLVWPLVAPLLIVKGAIVWIPRIWKAAWS